MKRRFQVVVSLKQGLLDTQGKAVQEALPAAGFEGVTDVRVGKLVEMTVEAANEAAALAIVGEIAGRVLSNPVIEEFRVLESEEAGA